MTKVRPDDLIIRVPKADADVPDVDILGRYSELQPIIGPGGNFASPIAAASWNSLLNWARQSRTPAFDQSTQMYHFVKGSPAYYAASSDPYMQAFQARE